MAEPSSYVTAKIASAVGGLVGGSVLMSFIQPKTIGEAFIRGGISVGSAIIFANPLIVWLDIVSNWETQLMSGAVIGFCAYFVLGAIANFFVKNQKQDLFTAIGNAKTGAAGRQPSTQKAKAKPRGKRR